MDLIKSYDNGNDSDSDSPGFLEVEEDKGAYEGSENRNRNFNKSSEKLTSSKGEESKASLKESRSSMAFEDVDQEAKAEYSTSMCSVLEQNFQPETTNFFGISNTVPGSFQHQLNLKPIQKTNLRNIGSEQVEIPESNFWSDFMPSTDLNSRDNLPTQTSHSEYYKRQTEESHPSTVYNSKETKTTSHSLDGSESRPPNDFKFRSGVKRKAFCLDHQTDYANQYSPQNLQSHSLPLKSQRKIFYVHSKVAPYLHAEQGFKLATRFNASWSAHNGAVNRISWNHSNFSHLLVSTGMDAKIRVWSVWSGVDPCVSVLNHHKKAIRHVDWCQHGKSIFSCSYDKTAQITDVETEQIKGQLDHTEFVTAGTTHPTTPHLVATGTEDILFMWDVRTPQAPVKHFSHKEAFGQVQDLLFISDGRELVSCGDCISRDSADRSIMVWDTRSGAVLSNQIYQERYSCTRLKLHRERQYFLAQSHGGYVALFSSTPPYKMEKSKRFGEHKLLGYSIGFDLSPDGKLVYSGSAEGGVHCYDYRTGKALRRLASGADDVIMDVACHPVLPSVLAGCTWGGSIRMWQ